MKFTKKRIIHKKERENNNGPPDEANVEETLKWYENEIEQNPKDTGLYYAKAALLAQEGRYEESLATLDRIIDLDPDNQKVLYIKANTLYELQKYEEAIVFFDMILKFAEDDERVWYHKGDALSKLQRYQEAIECYDNAINIDRNFTEAWLGRGNALRKMRLEVMDETPENLDEDRKEELENALDSYSIVIDQNPYSEVGWHGKGNVLYKLGRYDEALPCYDRSIDIRSDYIKSWYGRGKTLQKLVKNEEATRSFENALRSSLINENTDDLESLCARANSFYELGRYEEALDYYNLILERHPDNNYILEAKGTMLEKLGRKKEANRCFKEAIELNSKNVSELYSLGNQMSNAGDYDSAMEYYNEAVQLEPEFEDAWLALGELLSRQNEHEKAKECFSWIMQINPNNKRAKLALETLYKKINGNELHKIDTIGLEDGQNGTAGEIPYERKNVLYQKLEGIPENMTQNGIISQAQNISSEREDSSVYLRELLIKAREYIKQEKLTEALACIDKALELKPDCGDAWNIKGDILVEIGRFDDATSCYKKSLFSSLKSNETVPSEGKTKPETTDSEWKESIISLIDTIIEDSEKGMTGSQYMQNEEKDQYEKPHDKGKMIIACLTQDSEKLDKSIKPEDGRLYFECPICGSIVDLDERICSNCYTTFLEEEFKNDDYIDDDLIFFDKLRRTISSDTPFFIHFDGDSGQIKFLEKRNEKLSGKNVYVIVKGSIEKISWDYSLNPI